ncbi:hypothetical protein [Chamaesiphon sp. VAR_48_metabat_403]|uniref:hypothetical protein n=1 Tax=Chamaesiphon sp. VAR_48_metabat_403 TaxID=2964700 RepID=UPI00286E3FEB|nr:hypothetical protein [Chamaesiphon sp. VAR_48_metabat_403]
MVERLRVRSSIFYQPLSRYLPSYPGINISSGDRLLVFRSPLPAPLLTNNYALMQDLRIIII